MILYSNSVQKSGHEKDAVNVLRYALELAAEGEWIRPFVESGNEVNDLLMKLKEQSVQPEFLNQILVKVEQKKEIHSVVSRQETGSTEMKQDGDRVPFTTRELEVFKYVEEGLRNKEIAAKLFISDDAIKKHLYNMFQKIGVNNRINLIKQGRQLGYIENSEMLSE